MQIYLFIIEQHNSHNFRLVILLLLKFSKKYLHNEYISINYQLLYPKV